MAEIAREQTLDSLKGCLALEEYSDLVLTCGPDTYKLHKVVVCSRVEFFRAAVGFGGQKHETQRNKVDLSDDDPEAVKLLVQYLYEVDYDPKVSKVALADLSQKGTQKSYGPSYRFPHTCYECESKNRFRHVCLHHICGQHCDFNCCAFVCEVCAYSMGGPASQLLAHAQLYELADKYGVVGLKALCQHKFRLACTRFWNDDSFPIAANYVFSTTPDNDKGLRDIVSTTISDHMVLLKKPEVEAFMKQFIELTFGLLKAKAAKDDWA